MMAQSTSQSSSSARVMILESGHGGQIGVGEIEQEPQGLGRVCWDPLLPRSVTAAERSPGTLTSVARHHQQSEGKLNETNDRLR
jgi:hypothetical protein